MLSFGNQPLLDIPWTTLKSLVALKNLSLQYECDTARYTVFATDAISTYYSILYRVAPFGVPGFDQESNDGYVADFEQNYKPYANKATPIRINLYSKDGYTVGDATNPIRFDPTGTTPQPITDGYGSLTIDTPQLPSALVGSRLDINNGAWLGSTAPTVGQKTMANSIPVVIASDQTSIPVSMSGSTNGGQVANIVRTLEFAITTHVETAINLNYTVTSGKSFYLSFFGGIASSPQPAYFRLKVAGATVLTRLSSGHGSDGDFSPSVPILLATSGQQITFTIDPQNPNGTGWVGIMGFEV